jgi:hypothetical protein
MYFYLTQTASLLMNGKNDLSMLASNEPELDSSVLDNLNRKTGENSSQQIETVELSPDCQK